MPPATAHRAHADDLEIEAAAKRRLTDEYDAVQARGEVTRLGTNQSDLGISDGNTRLSTAANIRLSRKAIHDARLTRDAEVAAKRRHTDEYDAAQARGEIAGHGWSKVEPANLTTNAELGLCRYQVHDPRIICQDETRTRGSHLLTGLEHEPSSQTEEGS